MAKPRGRPYMTNLIFLYDKETIMQTDYYVDKRKAVIVILLDLSKAFEMVYLSHHSYLWPEAILARSTDS